MPLAIGSRLGPYEILATAGSGGMGEVYRARDTRLDRTVAIKVLPPHIAQQPEARARFEREARAVSSLNHPHICALYDIGREGAVDYIVMEFLEGETLAQRLMRGALPIPHARKIAAETADAVDRAHRQGVVHRDLKPANIMLTKDGVKLLDFGIAKSRPAKIGPADDTLSQALTGQGTLLGTPQYMSPEQLQGMDADARSDIFGLGCVLYEMIAGRRAFDQKNPATVIAAIVAAEPPPIGEIQPSTPAALRRLIATCLAKEPDDRWQSARDVQLLLEALDEAETGAAAAPSRTLPWAVAAAVLAVAVVALGVAMSRREPAAAGQPYRLNLTPPAGSRFRYGGGPTGGMAFSRDGRTLAFVAVTDGRSALWVRALDSGQSRLIPGTEDATMPFWSPDGKSIGFFAEAKLKRVDISGGAPPRVLCDALRPSGGSWNVDGVILFSARGVFRVPAAGGEAAAVVAPDPKVPGPSHQWPQFLSDGRRFLYWHRASVGGSIRVTSLADPAAGTVVAGPQFRARLIPASADRGAFLVWVRDGALVAQAFDEASLKLSGETIPLAEGMGSGPGAAAGDFSVATTGAVLFALPGLADQVLARWDRDGRETQIVGPAGAYGSPRFSPEGARIAYAKAEVSAGRDLWITDLKRSLATRFTFDRPPEFSPVWSPDGARIAFTRGPPRPGILVKSAAGADGEQVLAEAGEATITDWSRDGKFLLLNSRAAGRTDFDLGMLPLAGDSKPAALLASAFDERDGQLSPNGRFLAYVSNESGRHEVYVRAFPANAGRWQVSAAGGGLPLWSASGRELFYVSEDSRLMAAPVRTDGSAFVAEAQPAPLFPFPGYSSTANYSYDAASDGKSFVVIRPSEQAGGSLTILLNWWTVSAP